MNILEQKVLELLAKSSNIDLKRIKKGLKFDNEEESYLEELLDSLEEKGEIYKDKYGNYSLMENHNNLACGKVHFTEDGTCYIATKDNYRIYIFDSSKNQLVDKDFVVVKNIVQEKKYYKGKIDKILKRNVPHLACEVIFENGTNKLIPCNSKSKNIIEVSNNPNKYGVGEIVTVDFTKTDKGYEGHIYKSIGHKDEPDMDEKTIAYDHGFEVEFSPKYMKELEKIPTIVDKEKAIKDGRRDLTDKNIFTIDGSDTKDIDDAVCVEKLPDGNYRLIVSIADVAHYIKPGSEIDKEAFKRATSVYMNDTVIPMFHPKISNGICSLHPKVNRLTKTCDMIIDKNGKVIKHEIYDSIICSKKKMTYEAVNDILLHNEIPEGYEDYVSNLKTMNELSKIMEKVKYDRGYLSFCKDEIKAKGKGENISFSRRIQRDAEKLIENFMLLANETVASNYFYSSVPFLYRIHEAPNEDTILAFVDELNKMGYHFKPCKGVVTNKYIQNMLEELSTNETTKDVYSELLLTNAMKRATYSNLNIKHFGLALKHYTHFTSPIRRYIDLEVGRLIDLYKKCYNNDNELDKELGFIARHCTERSNSADKAEREARQMRMAEFMEENIGKPFTGTIFYLGDKHMKVKLENGIIGSLNYDDMGDGTYTYDKNSCSLKNKEINIEYKLGDTMYIRVLDASKRLKTVSFKKDVEKELRINNAKKKTLKRKNKAK